MGVPFAAAMHMPISYLLDLLDADSILQGFAQEGHPATEAQFISEL